MACERTHAETKRSLAQRVDHLSREIDALELARGGSQADERIVEFRRERDMLVANLGAVDHAIRRHRGAYEEKLIAAELGKLDAEERDLLERTTRARLTHHASSLAAWREGSGMRDLERQRLITLHGRLERELATANERIESVREPLVSRTVAGFLIWVGYSAVGCTGAAIAYLLRSSKEPDVVSALAQSVFGIAGAMRGSLPPWLVLPISALLLVLLLMSARIRASTRNRGERESGARARRKRHGGGTLPHQPVSAWISARALRPRNGGSGSVDL